MEKQEVADKALDLLSSFASSLSETLKNLAPEVWRIMVRQQYAEAAAWLLTATICAVVAIAAYKGAKKAWKKSDDCSSDSEPYVALSIFCYAAMGLLLLLAVKYFLFAVKMFVNPEFYAIKELMNLAK